MKRWGIKLNEEVSMKLMAAINQFRRLRKGHKHNTELKPSDMMMLMKMTEMCEAGEEVSVSSLSAALGVSRPFVTNALNSIVNDGFVERKVDESDRRLVHLSVSPKGVEIIERSKKEFMSAIDGLVKHLGEEKSVVLADLMGETYTYLAAYHGVEVSAFETSKDK